jgi:hypothetical protein
VPGRCGNLASSAKCHAIAPTHLECDGSLHHCHEATQTDLGLNDCVIYFCVLFWVQAVLCAVSAGAGGRPRHVSTDEIHGRPLHVTTDEIPSDGCRDACRVAIIVYVPAIYCVHPPLRGYVWVKAGWSRPRHVATDEIPPKRRVW